MREGTDLGCDANDVEGRVGSFWKESMWWLLPGRIGRTPVERVCMGSAS